MFLQPIDYFPWPSIPSLRRHSSSDSRSISDRRAEGTSRMRCAVSERETMALHPSRGLMRKRSFVVVAVLLFLHLPSIRAEEPPSAADAAKPWQALWRFDTHG